MNTNRYIKSCERDPDGHKLCKVCKKRLPPRRSSYCSDECFHRNTPSIMREMVYRRDHGVCAKCGYDSGALAKHFVYLRDLKMTIDYNYCHELGISKMVNEAYESFKRSCRPRDWQADHIIPVAEGGGLCGLEGYRTLCTICHKRESAALAKRLVVQREDKRLGPRLF